MIEFYRKNTLISYCRRHTDVIEKIGNRYIHSNIWAYISHHKVRCIFKEHFSNILINIHVILNVDMPNISFRILEHTVWHLHDFQKLHRRIKQNTL